MLYLQARTFALINPLPCLRRLMRAMCSRFVARSLSVATSTANFRWETPLQTRQLALGTMGIAAVKCTIACSVMWETMLAQHQGFAPTIRTYWSCAASVDSAPTPTTFSWATM